MIQKAKSKHELNKIISFNNIDKKFNLDELKEKIIKTEKVDKSFKDKEFNNNSPVEIGFSLLEKEHLNYLLIITMIYFLY